MSSDDLKADLKADLQADLLADLGRPTVPSAPAAAPAAAPAPVPSGALGGTPALSVTLTPLRWSLPSLDATERGLGVAVLVGPWRVEVAF